MMWFLEEAGGMTSFLTLFEKQFTLLGMKRKEGVWHREVLYPVLPSRQMCCQSSGYYR
jgi:hypothetical protein